MEGWQVSYLWGTFGWQQLEPCRLRWGLCSGDPEHTKCINITYPHRRWWLKMTNAVKTQHPPSKQCSQEEAAARDFHSETRTQQDNLQITPITVSACGHVGGCSGGGSIKFKHSDSKQLWIGADPVGKDYAELFQLWHNNIPTLFSRTVPCWASLMAWM